VAGPAATRTARMQQAAAPGEIAVSRGTAALLGDPALTGKRLGPGLLLRASPRATPQPASHDRGDAAPGLDRYLPEALAGHLRAGQQEGEHRRVAIAFVRFAGTDHLLEAGGPDRLAAALQHLLGSAQDAAHAHGVTFLETDICPEGGNIMLVAGAPRSAGHDEDRLLGTVRAILGQPGDLTLRTGAHAGRVFTGDLGRRTGARTRCRATP
jgi:class 3 adenylate cyclase